MCDSVKSHHCLWTPEDGCPYNISIHISFPLPVLLTFSPQGAKILKETWGTNTLIPLYDNEDSVCGIIYNNKSYYFLKNLQGDIIEILDGDTGSTVVRYGYNAWGVCNSVQDYSGCNLANINPFRYRGYYYDNEIQMYYLQSRYYDPNVARFINGDVPEIITLGQKSSFINLFTYCYNNPVNMSDSNGQLAANIISGIVGALINVILDFITSALTHWVTHKFSFKKFKYNLFSLSTLLAAASGFASGLLISSKYKKWICAVGSGLIGGFTNIIYCIIKGKKISIFDLIVDVSFGLLWGYLGGSGVGNSYWRKCLFCKGGYFVYKGCRYTVSTSLRLIKPVIKDFVKSFAKYIGTQIADWLQKFVRKKV